MARKVRPAEPEGMKALKRRLRMTINGSVRDGEVQPEEAMAAIMTVVAVMVAQVRDDSVRQQLIDDVVENFPAAVTFVREVPEGATLQ